VNRFFGAEDAGGMRNLSADIAGAGKAFLYHTDEEGRILYDEESGDPLLIRPGEEDHEYAAEKAAWQERVGTAAEREGLLYGLRLEGLYPELLGLVPPERREGFEAKLEEALSASRAFLAGEFEAMAAREERFVSARRLGDIYSLRRQSEGESASAITEELINEAQRICGEGLAELEEKIEAASAEGGNLIIEGAEWLSQYKEQFERGLRAWEEAEERFLVRRLEWEGDAGEALLRGEEAWAAALTRFEEERKNWEIKAASLFESGAAVFERASADLEKAVVQAREEFERNSLLRRESGTARVQALVDVYLTSAGMADYSMDSAAFWLERYVKGFTSAMLQAVPQSSDPESVVAELLRRLEIVIHGMGFAEAPAPGSDGFEEWLDGEIAFCRDRGWTPAIRDILTECKTVWPSTTNTGERPGKPGRLLTRSTASCWGRGSWRMSLGKGPARIFILMNTR
jgi:hypothetical protein